MYESNAALLMRERGRKQSRLTLGDKLLIATVGGLAFLATSPTLKERSDGRKNVAGVPTTTHATQSTYQPKPYMVIRGSDGSVKVYEERQDGTLSPIPNPATELVKAAEGVVAGRELYK